MWRLLTSEMRRRQQQQTQQHAHGKLSEDDAVLDLEQEQHSLKRDSKLRCVSPAAAGAVPVSSSALAARCRPHLAYAVAVVFLLFPFLEHHVGLPELIWKLMLVASLVFLGYQIAIFKRWSDEFPYCPRFLACFVAMVVELLWENVMVWIVSATDLRKYEDPPGLQDNGEILFNFLADRNALLGWFIHGKWANIMHFLGCVLCLAFSVAWEQHPFSGFGVMARFCLTICLSRILRVVSFMSTVLPSPRPGCYRRRFPPPPDTWRGILAVGIRQLRGFGGCNDLIFSGHGAFWVLGPLTFQTYYPNPLSSGLLWLALVQTSIRDVIDRQHYSVDMFLAVVVTWAVWGALAWVYPESRPLPPRPPGAAADKPNPFVVAVVALGLLAAAIAVFVAKS